MSLKFSLVFIIFATIASIADAQTKGSNAQQGKISPNNKVDKPTNEAVGPTVQLGSEPNFGAEPSHSGLLFNAIQSNGQQHNPPVNQPIYSPSQWPGAPEPFQIVQPSVSSQASSYDNKGFDALSNSPYQELLKNLASTAPMYPPEPLGNNNGPNFGPAGFAANGESAGFQSDPEASLEPSGPARPPLNIDNANYLTAVASLPTRVGPVLVRQQQMGGMFPGGASIYPGQGMSVQNFQPKISSSAMYQGPPPPSPNQQGSPPFLQFPPPGPMRPQNNGPINPANVNPNQYVYTHSGNQFPSTQNLVPSPPGGSKSSQPFYPMMQNQKYSQEQHNPALFQFNSNFVRPSQQGSAQQFGNANTHRHPLNQSFGPILDSSNRLSASGQPRLSPFTVQVGDILGFPPGTPFSAVPAGLPSGSRMNRDGAAFQVMSSNAGRDQPTASVEFNPVRRLYSELASSVVRPNTITKPNGFEKSQETIKENKIPLSMTSNASVVSFARSMCQVCDEIDNILKQYNITVYTFELDTMEKGHEMFDLLQSQTGSKDVPQVFICGKYAGGYSKILDLHRTGELQQLLQRC